MTMPGERRRARKYHINAIKLKNSARVSKWIKTGCESVRISLSPCVSFPALLRVVHSGVGIFARRFYACIIIQNNTICFITAFCICAHQSRPEGEEFNFGRPNAALALPWHLEKPFSLCTLFKSLLKSFF